MTHAASRQRNLKIVTHAIANPHLTQSQLAKRFGVSQCYIASILNKQGIRVGKGSHHYRRDPKVEAKCLLAIKMNPDVTYTELARRLNVSFWSLQDIAIKYGIHRPRGRKKGQGPAITPNLVAGYNRWCRSQGFKRHRYHQAK